MKTIILITDLNKIDWIFDCIGMTSESFNILDIFSLNGADEYRGYHVKAFNQIGEIKLLEYDYLLNVTSIPEQSYQILARIAGVSQIMNYEEFSRTYLDGNIIMKCLKNQIERERPDLSEMHHLVQIGDFSYGAPFVAVDCKGVKLTIGKFCSISKEVMFLLGEDHRTDWNSTYPFNVKIPEYSHIDGHPTSKGDIKVGNDVWIATGARILSGVSIGDGCVIGANTVVTRSVPPYHIVAGNPGKIVRPRFAQEQTEQLLEMKWWDWEYMHIYNAIPFLQSNNIDALYCYYKENVR